MENKWRSYIIIILGVLAIYTVVPTFMGEDAPYWVKKTFPNKKISLGLDLKGGTHLVLGVDIQQVLLENTDRYANNLKERLKKLSIKNISRIGDTTRIKIVFSKDTDKSKVEELIAKDRESFQYVYSNDKEFVVELRKKLKDYIKKRAVEQTVEAIRNRIDEFGVTEPSIMAQGEDRIIVQLPGVKDPARAKSIIGRTAKLEFKIVVQDKNYGPEVLAKLISDAEKKGIKFKDGDSYFKYVTALNKFLNKKIPSNTMVLFQKKIQKDGKKALTPYLLTKVTEVTGEHLDDAFVRANQYNEPQVNFSMSVIGSKLFANLTGKNINKQLAIVLDKNVYSAPSIRARISNNGVISLDTSKPLQELQKEAQDLALVLRAGALPTQMNFEEERTVGPTLGSDSIHQGAKSMVIASILIILFMLIYYRGAGVIANIALTLNVLIIMMILVLFEAVLTLPGIAGIVLTVGMSVDANVIIFERIREEMRAGNSVHGSVESGYSKALHTILDANITTAIAGIVLLQYGTGPIKGFAVTLLIGIISSVFTAVYVSKWIFIWWISKRNPKSLSI